MNNLIENLKDQIVGYFLDEKISQIDLDKDTEFEIFKMVEYYTNKLKEDIEELNDEVDTEIEQALEPSDYEYDIEQDNAQRLRDLA